MSEPGRAHDEEILRALLCGDATPDQPDMRDALARSPELKAEWEALRETQKCLAFEDREREHVLQEIEHMSATPEEDAALARLRSIMQVQATVERPRRRRSLALVLAAAAVILIAIWVPWDRLLDRGRPPGTVLGTPGKIELLTPVGRVSRYGEFRWQPPSEPVASYRLLLLEKGPDGRLEEIKLVSSLSSPAYEPDIALPPRIVWRVMAFDRFDRLIAKGEAEASTASH
jgi:hypothetical protein